MNVIELTDPAELPDVPLVGHIACSLEQAISDHEQHWGAVENVYRLTRNKKITIYIEKEGNDEKN